jgi:hypothetical protein
MVWLQRKVEHLEANLQKAKNAEIEKLRAQGQAIVGNRFLFFTINHSLTVIVPTIFSCPSPQTMSQ